MSDEISEKARKYVEDIQRIFAEDQKRFDEIERLFDEMIIESANLRDDVKELTEEIRHNTKILV